MISPAAPVCVVPKNQAIVWQVVLGWPGAMPVPGDYDGDRNADLAVFDTITGSGTSGLRSRAKPWFGPTGLAGRDALAAD